MRALICDAFGSPRDLRLIERSCPEPAAGEVLVAVEPAGLGYVDALFVKGAYQVKPPPPFVLGGEIAGTFVAVGESVGPARVGSPKLH